MFLNSNLLEHFKTSRPIMRISESKLIHRKFDKKVTPSEAVEFCKLASKFTFDEDRDERIKVVYRILIECMSNTDNHAIINRDKEVKYNWYLSLYCDNLSKISYFTFLDLGKGIFYFPISDRESIKNRLKQNNIKNINDKKEILKIMLNSGLSRTIEKDRGKGLPSICKCSQEENIKNFVIISNNIKASLDDDKIVDLNRYFHGTLLYWELHP